MDTTRVYVYSVDDRYLFEISPNDMWECYEFEQINGQHYIEITTTRILRREQRILTQDATGKWREYVVMSENASHANGMKPYGKYRCPWSIQHDLSVSTVSEMPGTQAPVTAALALRAALSGTERWTVGSVTNTTTGGASMYQMSGWKALSVLLDTWGGEIDVQIEVDGEKVSSRRVDLYDAMGSETARRRFDYSDDMSGIIRKVGDSPVACRIIPRGKGEQVGDGYGRKITIESVNDGKDYLQNDEAAELFKLPDGSGGYEYPTVYADNPEIEAPSELKSWGLSVINRYTTPDVTYDIDVIQLVSAGTGSQGVALGDVVQVVDKEFGDSQLRIQSRILAIRANKLDDKDIRLTIGNTDISSSLGSSMSRMLRDVTSLQQNAVSTSEYLDNLLENINAQINETGGYWYVVRGHGTRTYDTEVSDPLVGAEASQVVEVKGGTIRIANSRTPQGEWDWRTMFDAGRVAADMVVAAQMTSGYIRSADNNVFIDLDNGIMRLSPASAYGDTTLEDALSDAKRYATDYLTYENGELTLGMAESVIRSVLTNSQLVFRTNENEDVAWFGLNAKQIWEMFIETATIRNRLSFGDFSWIARENGNMTLKWIGV